MNLILRVGAAIGTLFLAGILIVIGYGTYLAYKKPRLKAIGPTVFLHSLPLWFVFLAATILVFWLFFVRGR